MDTRRFEAVRRIFQHAISLDASARAQYLGEACDGDSDLRKEVDLLLAADGQPVFGTRVDPLEEIGMSGVPRRIGPYRVIRLIGAGAMGEVYEAEQEQPRRTVAVKVMKASVASPASRRRFEVEFELLGRLRHPGIAQIYEAGTAATPLGERPFFVMERVEGRALSEYLSEDDTPSLENRLELFCAICDAIQHAHQRGVIHRDLKPANILVESSGRPKVVDFGVARTFGEARDDTMLLTEVGQLVGTLGYMSPEQLEADPRAIDTRTDVYSLGVILFELITGRHPHQLAGKSVTEIARLIREEVAGPPSAVSDLAIDRDLDLITGKALAKDREVRYASAAELSADIRRYRRHEPVLARPPSGLYHLNRYARRHRAACLGFSVAALAVVVGLVVSTGLYLRERDALAKMERSHRVVSDVVSFLVGALKQPGDDPDLPEVTVRSAIERGVKLIDSSALPPESVGWIQYIVGGTFQAINRLEDAERHLVKSIEILEAHDPENERVLAARLRLSGVLVAQSRFEEAIPLAQRVIDQAARLGMARQEEQGLMVALGAYRQSGRADQVERVADELLAMAETRAPHAASDLRSAAYQAKGNLRLMSGDPAGAADHLLLALEHLRERGDESLECQLSSALSVALSSIGDARAIEHGERALELTRRIYGRLHGNTSIGYSNYASLLWRLKGDGEGALAALSEALAISRELFEAPNHIIAVNLNNLGMMYHELGRPEEAVPRLRESVEMDRALSELDGSVATTLGNLARALHACGRFDEALDEHRAALDLMERELGEDHVYFARQLRYQGDTQAALGDLDAAIRSYRRGLDLVRRHRPDDERRIVRLSRGLAELLERRGAGNGGDADEAVALRATANELSPADADD